MTTAELKKFCTEVRRDIINMTANAGSGHPGGSLSMTDLMTCLFFNHMRIDPKDPKNPNRDRFVLSKGHCAPCYYAVLAERGFIDTAEFENFRQLHSILQGHPDVKKCPGVDASTGSLGQGISCAVGMAMGAKYQSKDYRVYTIVGDGESEEGQVWEAAMFAAHYKLDNLVCILDWNGLQIDGNITDVMNPEPIADKFIAFGWNVIVVDGHNHAQIKDAIEAAKTVKGKPTMVVCRCIKGKDVSFMENQYGWHGTAPNQEQRDQAIAELDEKLAAIEAEIAKEA